MYQPITDRKIKIALVGCGRISKNHFEAIAACKENLELVAVCDTNPEALKKEIDSLGVDGYGDIASLLKYSDADVISLCTPSGLHPQQAILSARAGKHVITEKPMATTWRDGVDMIKAADEAQKYLFVVKQNRLNPPLQLLKKAITTGRFGRIYLANVNVYWTRPQSYYDQASWRGTWELDGGALMNQASHYVDLLRWLIGPVESIHAYTATLARNIEAEDTVVLNIRWRNGALGSMNVTMLTYPKNLEGSITILGEKGSAIVGGVAVNEIKKWEFADSTEDDGIAEQSNYQTHSVYGHGHMNYYKNVVDVIRGKESLVTDGRDGLSTLELLIAAYRSARTSKAVFLPLEY